MFAQNARPIDYQKGLYKDIKDFFASTENL